MLCPEVWNFKAPESHFSSKKYDVDSKQHLNIIQDFTFTHLVSVILPDTLKVPESLTEALSNDCDYYKLNNVKISEFVNKNFINNFVNSGTLYAVSVGTRIDCDNCVAITPTGHLILHLNKSTYQGLGLEGTVSHFHNITSDKYIVSVDLKAKQFKPGKPNYERTKTCLEKIASDVIVTWEPPNQDTCPSSVAKYFFDLGYKTKLCEIQEKSHIVYSIKVPEIQDDNHFDIVEWLGMVSINGDLTSGKPDDYVTTYEVPEPCKEVGQVRYMQWRGFFTTNQIVRFHDKLRQFQGTSDWVAMYVQGFSDSVVAWRNEEHHYYTNGDNSYSFILTKDHLIACLQKCSRKRYNNKRKGKPL